MARITVEDCLKEIPNRFELILIAANRARELENGENAIIEAKKGEKNTVIALREVASGKFTQEKLEQFCRRFIFESKKDSQEVFDLKKFFLSNFDSREEYYIQAFTSHSDIKKRTDILLEKYIQFFHYYL